jgi:hypothetical protein
MISRGDLDGRPIRIKKSCAGGAPPRMKGAPLLLIYFLPGRGFQKTLSPG